MRALIAPHPYLVFLLSGRNATKEGIAQEVCGERRPSIALRPAIARPRCSSLRWKRSDDSERAFASLPNPCRIRRGRNFGGENYLVPFARATEAIRPCCPATPDLRTSTKNSSSLPDESPEINTLSADVHAINKSFELLFILAQRCRQSARHFPRTFHVIRLKRDRRHSLVPAAAKLLRQRRQILIRRRLIPWIRSERDFRPRCRRAHADRIYALPVQQIRNEFVVALEVQVAHIEENHAVFRLGPLPQYLDRLPVSFQKRSKMLRHNRQLNHFLQRLVRQLPNDLRWHSIFGGRFDHERQLRRRFLQFHRRLRRWKLCAINNVAPINQISEWRRIESKFLPRRVRNQFCAGLVVRLIVKVLPGRLFKLRGIRRRQECALVMVEPPRHLRRIRILEIDNRILVAIEQSRFPRLLRAVRHARETKLCVRIKFFAVKTVKKGSRSGSVKAAVVETEPDSGHIRAKRAFPAARSVSPPATKPLTMRCPTQKVKTPLFTDLH